MTHQPASLAGVSKLAREIVTPEGHYSQIIKELESITAYGHGRQRVISDWIALMFYALQRDDPEYLAILAHYDKSEGQKSAVAQRFANAFGAILTYMQLTNKEVLGRIWMEFCANERLGQFFTPPNLCDMIATMTRGDDIPHDRDFTVNDPACGAGGMLVAFLKTLTSAEANRCVFVAQDIDRTCCMMTALNLCFFNARGLVLWGNALDLDDVRGAWVTGRSRLMGGSIQPYDRDTAKAFMRTHAPARKPEQPTPPAPGNIIAAPRAVQLSLL